MSIFDSIGKALKDPDVRDKLVIGLQGMTVNPNQSMMEMAQQNIKDRRDKRELANQSNKTLDFLRARGTDEATLQALQDNPQMLMAYTQNILKPSNQPSSVREYEYAKQNGYTGTFDQFKTLSANKTSPVKSYAPVVDPKTGQLSIPTFDPTDKTTSYVPVDGATSMTEVEKARLNTNEQVYLADVQKAKDAAFSAMQQSSSIQSKLPLYEEIVRKIDEGADSGFIMSRLPAMNEATATLRSAANQLGITVINSATFGALSEKELALALSTEIPQNLSPKDLRSYVVNKYEAQAKLANEINKKARMLSSSGMTYTQYVNQVTSQEIPTKIQGINLSIDDADVERIE